MNDELKDNALPEEAIPEFGMPGKVAKTRVACTFCGKLFNRAYVSVHEKRYCSHRRSYSKSRKAMFECDDPNCEQAFTTKQGLAVHKIRMHKQDVPTRTDANQDFEMKPEFRQAFNEMMVKWNGWTILARDNEKRVLIVLVPMEG